MRLGNGPYTLAGAYGEPANSNFATVDSSFLPDRPSRQAYIRYQELLNDWEKKIDIPPNTPRALGGPAYGFEWDEAVVREGFKSLTGVTPNMLEWIVETALEEAFDYPHPMQNVSLLLADQTDKYGRTTKKGQYDMLFSYISGEEYGHKIVHFWFEGHRMITSLSYNSEYDPINGEQARTIRMLKEEREAMLEDNRQAEFDRQEDFEV